MNNKNTDKRITVMYEALMDISHMDKGHDCKCQCANHCIEHASDALKKESDLRWEATKVDRCFAFHLPDMDRLFKGMEKWNWKNKNYLTVQWKELAYSIRIHMNYSPYYSSTDILHRWFGKWKKYHETMIRFRPMLSGNKLIQVLDEEN